MEQPHWNEYYQHTKHHPPRPLLVRAVSLLGRTGEALDLGCGAGSDARYLLACGFQVTAVDSQAAALANLADIPAERLCRVQSTFEDFSFACYDLVNAQFALPFMHREQFAEVFTRLKISLKPGGIFVGQFFGVNDSWNTSASESGMTFLSEEQARAQLAELEIVVFEEEDQDGMSGSGPKHWHVYHMIARQT